MNSLSNIEQEFKRILEAQDFEYQEAHWIEAKKLLARKKKRRRVAVWFILPAILGGSILSWWALQRMPLEPVSMNQVQVIKKVTPSKTPTDTQNLQPMLILPSNSRMVNPDFPQFNLFDNRPFCGFSVYNSLNQQRLTQSFEWFQNQPLDIADSTKQEINIAAKDPIQNDTKSAQNDTNNAQNDVKDAQNDAKNAQKNTIKPPKDAITFRHSISVVGGGNYSRMLQGGAQNFISAPYIGLWYHFQPNKYWQIATGLAYTVQNGGSLQKEFESKRHSFGVTTTTTSIRAGKLHYIEMPLFARRELFGNKICLLSGINLGYLIHTNNTVTESKNSTLGGKSVVTKKVDAGNKGVSDWDVQFFIGAETRFYNRWKAGLMAGTSLFDVGINNYYNNTVTERNARLQVYIRYELIKF